MLESRTGQKKAETKRMVGQQKHPTDNQEERERRVERGTKEGEGEATEREERG